MQLRGQVTAIAHHEGGSPLEVAEVQLHEADRFARRSVRTLEKCGEQALLAEALTTYGIVQARLGN